MPILSETKTRTRRPAPRWLWAPPVLPALLLLRVLVSGFGERHQIHWASGSHEFQAYGALSPGYDHRVVVFRESDWLYHGGPGGSRIHRHNWGLMVGHWAYGAHWSVPVAEDP